MTYGGGSIACGSSCSSGSAVSFSTVAIAGGNRSRQRNNDDEDWFPVCMAALAAFVMAIVAGVVGLACFLLCMCPMSRRARLGVVCFWIVAGPITLGCIFGLLSFGPWRSSLSPTDQQPIRKFHPLFCQEVQITTTQNVDYYLLNNRPVISADRLNYSLIIPQTLVESQSYKFWGFYIIEGSEMQVTIGSINYGMPYFFLFRGEDQFKRWISDAKRGFRFRHYEVMFTRYGTNRITLNSTGMYFFVSASLDKLASISTMTIGMKLKRYNFTEDQLLCASSVNCTAKLSLNELNKNIYVSPSDKNQIAPNSYFDPSNFSTKVHSKCIPRLWIYLVFFSSVPIMIGVFASLLVWFCCCDCENAYKRYKNKKTASRPSRQNVPSTSTSSLVSNAPVTAYNNKCTVKGCNNDAPPSYDSIINFS